MLILAAMFVTLFNSYCSVCLSKGFSLLLQHCKIGKKIKKVCFFQVEQVPKFFSQLLAQSNSAS